jgi:hypothetical protein
MLKRDLFIAAMKAECYKRTAWIFSAFCITRENEDEYKKEPYAYRLVSTPTGFFYCDPTKNGELSQIEDAVAGEALFKIKDTLAIGPDDIPILDKELTVTYGSYLTNWIVVVHPFGKKLPYQVGKIKVANIEEQILPRFKSNPKEGETVSDEFIYVKEYIKFSDSIFFLTGLTQVCVWAATEKTMTAPPGIIEFRNKLLKENASELHKASTIAKIDKQLVEFDSAWLKGDPGENFLLSGKSRNVVRKKLFLMHGAETGLDENTVNVTLVKNSLSEGWDINAFPAMNDSLRAGSFNRGAQTALGGVSVKWLLRASSNLRVTEDDCGSRMGKVLIVDENNKTDLIGFNVIMKEGSKPVVSEEDANSYLHKKIMVRSPMYCKLTLTDFCKVCVGKNLSANPDGLSIAVSSYGTSFVSMYLKKMHTAVLATAKMDYNVSIT